MRRQLALLGGGGFACEVAEIAEANGYEIGGCYALEPGAYGAIHKGYLDALLADKDRYCGVALGVGAVDRRSMARRRQLIDWLGEFGFHCPALVAPTSIVAADVEVENGAFVGHGAILCRSAILRSFSIVNAGAIVGHDVVVGANAAVAPGAFLAGMSSVGRDSILGPLSKVLQGVAIGSDVILGIGCTALRALPDGATVWPRPDRAT